MRTITRKNILTTILAAVMLLSTASSLAFGGGVSSASAAEMPPNTYYLDFKPGDNSSGLSRWKDYPYFYLFQTKTALPSSMTQSTFNSFINGGSMNSTNATFTITFLSPTNATLFTANKTFTYAELQSRYSWDNGIRVTVNGEECSYPLLYLPEICNITLTDTQAQTLSAQSSLRVKIATSCYMGQVWDLSLCSEQQMGNPYTMYYLNGVYKYATLPADPEKEGHTFTGWYYDAACTQQYNGEPIFEGTPLYAGWQIHRHTVTFNPNVEGVTIPSQTVDWNTKATTPTTPEIRGYIFKGWYKDEACTIPFSFDTAVKEDITLYAAWEKVLVTVTFYVDGDVYFSMNVEYGTTLTAINLEPMLTSFSVQSVEYTDGYISTDTASVFAIEGEANIHLEKKSDIDTAMSWAQANWQVLMYSAIGVVGAIVIFSVISYFVRKNKRW